MRKIYLFVLSLLVVLPVGAMDNYFTQQPTLYTTVENDDSGEITFATQEEKEGEIKRLEVVIAKRKALGYTDTQLSKHYALLESYKNAKVLKKNENEK